MQITSGATAHVQQNTKTETITTEIKNKFSIGVSLYVTSK